MSIGSVQRTARVRVVIDAVADPFQLDAAPTLKGRTSANGTELTSSNVRYEFVVGG